jgi:hypothetical protein
MQGVQRVWLHSPGHGNLRVELQGFPATFWVVTKPTPTSELGDICFEANIIELACQFRGGLDETTIHGIYVSEVEAQRVAANLLAEVKKKKDGSSPNRRGHMIPGKFYILRNDLMVLHYSDQSECWESTSYRGYATAFDSQEEAQSVLEKLSDRAPVTIVSFPPNGHRGRPWPGY